MHGDGDGWVTCDQGHDHFGKWGVAAGVLLTRTGQEEPRVLLQRRSRFIADGDCWGIPGGALDSHETPHNTALRHLFEETGIAGPVVTVTGYTVDDHGGWMFVTVHASVPASVEPAPIELRINMMSPELLWFREAEVPELSLHHGIRAHFMGFSSGQAIS